MFFFLYQFRSPSWKERRAVFIFREVRLEKQWWADHVSVDGFAVAAERKKCHRLRLLVLVYNLGILSVVEMPEPGSKFAFYLFLVFLILRSLYPERVVDWHYGKRTLLQLFSGLDYFQGGLQLEHIHFMGNHPNFPAYFLEGFLKRLEDIKQLLLVF